MNKHNGIIGRDKDYLLGELVDYNQDSIEFREW